MGAQRCNPDRQGSIGEPTPNAEQMVEVFAAAPALCGGEAERPASRPVTPFEAKGERTGRTVVDLTYRRVGS